MIKNIIILLFVGLFLSGCTTTQDTAVKGAALGGFAGSIIGNQHRDRAGKGALIGAVVGGLAGTIVGQQKEAQEQGASADKTTIVSCPECNKGVDVTGLPAHSTVLCPYDKETKFTY